MNALRRSALLTTFGLAGLSSYMRVSELDPGTRRFPTRAKATVTKSVDTDLDHYTSLLLMPGNDFVQGQIERINYFEETMSIDQLEDAMDKHGLRARLPSVQDNSGIRRAYHEYKPFLWLAFRTRKARDLLYGQFVLIQPRDMSELFLVEQSLDYRVAGVTDQNTWYPMFNALVDYIDHNSARWSA